MRRKRIFGWLLVGLGVGWLLLVLPGCDGGAAAREEAAQGLLAQAVAAEGAGDLPTAVSTLQQITQNYNDTPTAVSTLQQITQTYNDTPTAVTAQHTLSRLLFAQAETAVQAGDYPTALQAYGGITEPSRLAEADTAVVQTYTAWVTQLLGAGDYETAAAQLSILEGLRPADPAIPPLRAQLAVRQGEQAIARGDVDGAYAAYIVPLSLDRAQYGAVYDTAVASFRANLAEPLWAAAARAAERGEFSTAVLAYEALAQHGTAAMVPVAQAEAARLTLRWAEALLAQGDYDGALAKLAYIRAVYPQSAVAAQAEERWVAAQVAQIVASGMAGELPPLAAGVATDEAGGDGNTAVYRVQNDTPCPILILLSGPGAQAVRVASTAVGETRLPIGQYTVVVQPDGEQTLTSLCLDLVPFVGQYDLQAGLVYNSRFFVPALEN